MSSDDTRDEILNTAKRIVKLGPICDSCLGRQFAMLSTGLTNIKRGHAIKTVLAMQASSQNDRELLEDLAPSSESARLSLGRKGEEDERCWVCLGEMRRENLDVWAERAAAALEGREYSTFLVGTRMSGLLAENEELLLSDGGSGSAEPFKSELNREVGKLIAARTGRKTDFEHPDVVVHLLLDGARWSCRWLRSISGGGTGSWFAAYLRAGGPAGPATAGAASDVAARDACTRNRWTS
jgi:tRNA pseudouridine synthase 10